MHERVGGKYLAGGAIQHIHITISIRVNQRFPGLSVDREIKQDVLIDAVVVMLIMWTPLIEPSRFAGVRVAGEYASRPFVVPRSLFRIPGAGIRRAIKDQVLLGVVGYPAPHGAAADLPLVRRPSADPQIRPAILRVKWLEILADQHVLIRAGAVSPPGNLAGVRVER